MAKDEKMEVPIWRKQNLTIMEAAEYSNIGRDKLYAMLQRRDCPFLLQVGTKKKLIKSYCTQYAVYSNSNNAASKWFHVK